MPDTLIEVHRARDEYERKYPDARQRRVQEERRGTASAAAEAAWSVFKNGAAKAAGYERAGQVPAPELPRVITRFAESADGKVAYARYKQVSRVAKPGRVTTPSIEGAPTEDERAEAKKQIERWKARQAVEVELSDADRAAIKRALGGA